MEENETIDLLRLLRAELTAVHQQFCHMLALRQWERSELLDRITAIDTVDFKNAMLIIDLLVSRQAKISLPSHQLRPGPDIASIVSSELLMERHLQEVIEGLSISDEEGKRLVDRAAAPRREYRDWLEAEFRRHETGTLEDRTSQGMALLLGELIGLVEQSMLRAFMLWHSERWAEADDAWRLSGAAMLYGTALVKRAALSNWLPTPSAAPEVLMTYDTTDAFHADMTFVRRCADLGRTAADQEDDGAMRRMCERISEDCDLILGMEPAGEFPAVFGRSPVFDSFARTRERHL